MRSSVGRVSELLFGRHPERCDVLLILATAVCGAALVMRQAGALAPLQQIILLVLALDVLGGMVANLTRATNDWYASRAPALSYLFLVVHAAQPLIAVLFLKADGAFFAFLYGYSLIAGSVVVGRRRVPSHRVLAVALMAFGMVGYNAFITPPPYLTWFGYAYLFKLVYAFAVNHSGKA